MNPRLLVFLCLSLTSVSAFGQTEAAQPRCESPDASTVDSFGPKVAADARQFLVVLQKAVRSDDRETIASMIYYPLHVYGQAGPMTITTKPDFLQHYNEVLSAQVKRELFRQSVACLGYASSGYTPESGSQAAFVIGSHGEIWFLNVGTNDAMKIITINR
jgi:hypothetical protein